MEELPREEKSRIYELLKEDECRRKEDYIHSNDIIVENSAAPFSIWPVPNADITRILSGEVDRNDIPWEDTNELQKGMLFEDQRNFILRYHPQKPMLCEVKDYGPCLREGCTLFRKRGTKAGGAYGICSEFKIAFQC